MFRCTACGQVDNFSLMLSADYTGPGVFKQTLNEHGEIVINIDGFEFIPDLAFMNAHAVCKFCNTIHSFEYYFEHIVNEKNKEDYKIKKPEVEVDHSPEKKKKVNNNEHKQ